MDGEKFIKMTHTEIKETDEYDTLIRQAKLIFPDAEDWLLEMATIAYFKNGCKDEYQKPNIEEVEKIKNSYSKELLLETPLTNTIIE